MRNPESRVFESLTIDQAYARAEQTLAKDAIKPEQFADLYSDENVAQDKAYVDEMERKFEETNEPEQKEVQKLATILEAIIHEHAELSDWLGPDAHTIKPSRYDDIKNGVDSVVEFQESESSASHLALAIDATFSPDVQKKFERIKNEIDRGELARVKYFASEHLGVRGELAKIPRVVIGADAKTVRELAELWLERDNRALARHPVQFQIIEEIVAQLDAFHDYATQKKQFEIAAVYDKTRKILAAIDSQKRTSLKDTGERDSVFYAIQESARNFG